MADGLERGQKPPTIDANSPQEDSLPSEVVMTSSKKKPDTPPTPPKTDVSELTSRQRYLLKKLSEAGLLTPLLEDLSRNIKLAQKEPGGEA